MELHPVPRVARIAPPSRAWRTGVCAVVLAPLLGLVVVPTTLGVQPAVARTGAAGLAPGSLVLSRPVALTSLVAGDTVSFRSLGGEPGLATVERVADGRVVAADRGTRLRLDPTADAVGAVLLEAPLLGYLLLPSVWAWVLAALGALLLARSLRGAGAARSVAPSGARGAGHLVFSPRARRVQWAASTVRRVHGGPS